MSSRGKMVKWMDSESDSGTRLGFLLFYGCREWWRLGTKRDHRNRIVSKSQKYMKGHHGWKPWALKAADPCFFRALVVATSAFTDWSSLSKAYGTQFCQQPLCPGIGRFLGIDLINLSFEFYNLVSKFFKRFKFLNRGSLGCRCANQ